MRHPIFQPAKPHPETGKFELSSENMIENALDFNAFMKYSEYINVKKNVTVAPNITHRFSNKTDLYEIDAYIPFFDPLGPYLFYPS